MIILVRIAAILAIAVVIGMSLGPVEVRAMSPVSPVWDRSLAYVVIGFLLMLSFSAYPWRVVMALLLLIVGLEAAQELRPGRHGRIIDAIEKSVGAGLGAAAASGAVWAFRRRKAGN